MLTVKNLTVRFGALRAVRNISFSMKSGEALGIIGESGSGKTALIDAIGNLSCGQVEGAIAFEGEKRIGMIFQNPMSSLNPTMTIGMQIAEGPIVQKLASKSQALAKAKELLHLVGISPARIDQYPHELSGGMRQRVMIAIAIACSPRLLLADEPTTALDVTVQAQVLALLQTMRKRLQMGLLLVSHDFGVIAEMCERVLVMYAGKIVEEGSIQEILSSPRHPYTQLLLRSLPGMNRSTPLCGIEGSPPDLARPIQGCAFKERCPYAALKCLEEPPGPIACWRSQ